MKKGAWLRGKGSPERQILSKKIIIFFLKIILVFHTLLRIIKDLYRMNEEKIELSSSQSIL